MLWLNYTYNKYISGHTLLQNLPPQTNLTMCLKTFVHRNITYSSMLSSRLAPTYNTTLILEIGNKVSTYVRNEKNHQEMDTPHMSRYLCSLKLKKSIRKCSNELQSITSKDIISIWKSMLQNVFANAYLRHNLEAGQLTPLKRVFW